MIFYRLAKQGDNVLGSVRTSASPFVMLRYVCNHVMYVNDIVDADDQLLILYGIALRGVLVALTTVYHLLQKKFSDSHHVSSN